MSGSSSPPFAPEPTARADLRTGTSYAVLGKDDWIYIGQVTPDGDIGFFRCRTRDSGQLRDALTEPVMGVLTIARPSITRALRSGQWKKLGRFPLADTLAGPRDIVQWPFGTLVVTVWRDGQPSYETRVENPAIQSAELMAVWDAEMHVPARLAADFADDEAEWHVGGPIWRERRVREEYARRFPDMPQHQLPPNWVPTRAG